MRVRLLKGLLIVLLVLMNIGCDQATKQIARAQLAHRGTVAVVDDFLVLRYVVNEGGFLSLGARLPAAARMIIFIAFPVIVLVFMLVYFFREKQAPWTSLIGFAFIAGGGFGNLIDRIFQGGRVSDFINVGIGTFRSGIFNMADLAVMIGCALLLFTPWKPAKPAQS
jgi:signal peptidase II